MIRKPCIPAVLAGLVLAGCAGNPGRELSGFPRDVAGHFPPAAVYLQQPNDGLKQSCETYDEQHVFRGCMVNGVGAEYFHESLRASGMFEAVRLGAEEPEYKVLVTTAQFSTADAGDMTGAFLSGLTLMAVPVSEPYDVVASVGVSWRGFEVGRYDYELAMEVESGLGDKAADSYQRFADRLMARFLVDARADGVFSPQYLAGALDASDYRETLAVPPRIAGFELVEERDFRDPLQGALRRYAHPSVPKDVIDVFVYPVRQTDWDDTGLALERELHRIREEIELVGREEDWRDMDLGKARRLSRAAPGVDYDGLYFTGTYRDGDGNQRITTVYLFIEKDKFVKLATTFPPGIANDYAREAMASIRVPPESVFMARLRQAYR